MHARAPLRKALPREPRAILVGSGMGGIVAAGRLRKALPREHRVILVEREARHVFQPSLLWLMTGNRAPENISRPVDALGKRGVEGGRGKVERIDPARRAVQVNGTEWTGEYLVIALGAEVGPAASPGLAE